MIPHKQDGRVFRQNATVGLPVFPFNVSVRLPGKTRKRRLACLGGREMAGNYAIMGNLRFPFSATRRRYVIFHCADKSRFFSIAIRERRG
jgi:hypothetical protein